MRCCVHVSCAGFLNAIDPLQVSFAFGRIESALNYILNHLNELSGLAAQAERLDALLAGMATSGSLPLARCHCTVYSMHQASSVTQWN